MQAVDAAPRSLPTPVLSFGLRSAFGFQVADSEEYPVRSPELAKQLIDLINNCPEAAAALEVICAYVLSSGTGDELGFAILPDKHHPQSRTVAAAREVINRVGDVFLWWQVIWRLLAWGDCFGLLHINTKLMMIESLQLLPTWQMFSVSDVESGAVSSYEQRFGGMKDKAVIQPMSMVQWSYNKRFLYGRSLYQEALSDWAELKAVDQDLSDASRTAAIQPNVHVMPAGADEAYKRAYREDHEARKKQGIIADIYLLQGAEVKKPPGFPGSFPLDGLIDHHHLRRLRIAARSRVPLYLLGIEQKSAQEIAMQPAISFTVFVGVVRQLFASGLRQLINTELALKQIPPDEWKYRIVFPKINVNPYAVIVDDTDVDQPGVEDVEDSAHGECIRQTGTLSEKRLNSRNGNGHA